LTVTPPNFNSNSTSFLEHMRWCKRTLL
jgi:hypothetical protein